MKRTDTSEPDFKEIPRIFTLLNGDVLPRCQEIEIASSFQVPHFQVIGLPGPEVSEAKDRIRSAIESSGIDFPKRKIVLNLSPASVRKQGTGLDLGMAIAVLLEGMRIEGKRDRIPYRKIFAWGELGLNGQIKSVKSPVRALASALVARADLIVIAREDEVLFHKESKRLFPTENFPRVLAVSHLREILPGFTQATSDQKDPVKRPELHSVPFEKPGILPIAPAIARFLEIAAAGSHHFLLLGPKGVGKSHALEWFIELQPELDSETLRTRSFLAEISGKADTSPYRRVSTQTKPAALIGSFSGGHLRPGEFSLAHGGVLLADEFPEWHRDSREALREPLERKKICLTRVDGSVDLPSDFIFAGNGNLCPCGGVQGSTTDSRFPSCRCLPADRSRYLSRLSGPVLDRLDLVLPLLMHPDPAVKNIDFKTVHQRVKQARETLIQQYAKPPGKLGAEELESLLTNSPNLLRALDAIPFGSFRDRHKTLRVALTLAALQGQTEPDERTLIEAKMLRLQADRVLR